MTGDTEVSAKEELVLTERRGGVLILTLNRPDRLNAWTEALEDRYYELLDQAQVDPEVRAIVVTGAGRGFCAGADMGDLEMAGNVGPSATTINRRRPRHYPLTIDKPMIAAINGAAIGLGLVEALYCDIRFCTPEAKLSTIFVQRGLIAEYGISWLLPRIVGLGHALDLLLSGRVILGEEAARLGLVNRVVEPDAILESAIAYADQLASLCSPTSMSVIKGQVHGDLSRDFESAYVESDRLLHESFSRPDVKEGVASYLERRPVDFPPFNPRR